MRLTKQMRKTLQTMDQGVWTAQELAAALEEPESSVRGRIQRAQKAGWVCLAHLPPKEGQNPLSAWKYSPQVYQVTEAGLAAVKP